jgi:large subunit ribosomal protein L1
MPTHGKKYNEARKNLHEGQQVIEAAIQSVRKAAFAKFDETVELHMRLGVNPRHADQMVRGTVVLPHGTGKTKRVLVIADGDKQKEAEDAGADFVGGAEMVKKIQEESWLDFEAVIATPDMMREVGKLGRVLGPRGLMPNPKTGTVTFDVGQAVQEVKAGKVEFRVDKTAIVHVPLGRLSFEDEKLVENAKVLVQAVVRAKPATAKGKYLLSIHVASTMGPGVPVDPVEMEAAVLG